MEEIIEIVITGIRAKVSLVKDGIRTTKLTTVEELGRYFRNQAYQDSGELAMGIRRVKKTPAGTYVILQCPAKIRRISIFGQSYQIPFPEHLFMLQFKEAGQLYKFYRGGAVAMDSKLLLPTSRVYEFPLGNVLASDICWGSTQGYNLPRNLNTGIDDLLTAFWAGNFNNHWTTNKLPIIINETVIDQMRDFGPALEGLIEFPTMALRPVGNINGQEVNIYADWLETFGLTA